MGYSRVLNGPALGILAVVGYTIYFVRIYNYICITRRAKASESLVVGCLYPILIAIYMYILVHCSMYIIAIHGQVYHDCMCVWRGQCVQGGSERKMLPQRKA